MMIKFLELTGSIPNKVHIQSKNEEQINVACVIKMLKNQSSCKNTDNKVVLPTSKQLLQLFTMK